MPTGRELAAAAGFTLFAGALGAGFGNAVVGNEVGTMKFVNSATQKCATHLGNSAVKIVELPDDCESVNEKFKFVETKTFIPGHETPRVKLHYVLPSQQDFLDTFIYTPADIRQQAKQDERDKTFGTVFIGSLAVLSGVGVSVIALRDPNNSSNGSNGNFRYVDANPADIPT